VAQLNGNIDSGTHALFVDFGGDASALTGGSRAAQFMLFEQAIAKCARRRHCFRTISGS